jgi:ADP-heptose:LPS heptosyltransferase
MILRWRGQKVPVVRVVSKQRLKTFAVLLLKRWCPTSWKPTPWKNVYASLGGAAAALPKLYTSAKPSGANAPTQKSDYRIGIAPGSAKAAKEWPTASWISLCTELHAFGASLVVLGLSQEPAVRALKKSLLEKKIPFEDHSQNLSPQHTLQSVGSLKRLIGVDSGLAHVAEALGVPSTVLFGPTHPDLGFGPHLPQSQTVCAGLSCQPCGKTSFPCHRRPKYLCQSSMSSDSVFKLLMSQESGQGQ